MFFVNENHVQNDEPTITRGSDQVRVNGEVLSTVERMYSLMEQEHARIRAQALAAHAGASLTEPAEH